MTDLEINNFIENNEWRVAKTMPKNPHEYCLRRNVEKDEDFVNFAKHIRENGYELKFGNYIYICFDVGPYRYWTMGCPLHNCSKTGTILINRAIN